MKEVFLLLFVHKKKILAFTCLLFLATPPAQAVEPEERLADPTQEARARAIGAELRCLVCQNESIDDSGAALAHDIRVLLRERIAAGDSDAAAQQAVVDRYGDFVLLRPPVKPVTYVLWFGPVFMLLLGAGGLVVWLRQRGAAPAETVAALSADERARLERMLRETES